MSYIKKIRDSIGPVNRVSCLTMVVVMAAVLSCFTTVTFAGRRIVIDESGRQVVVPTHPHRIVSLAPSITEILFFIGAGDKVIGVSDNSDFPEKARLVPRVGPYVKPDVEKIVSLSPDLVIATVDGTPKAVVDAAQRLGLALFAVNPRSVHDVVRSVRLLGDLVGSCRADEIARQMLAELDIIKRALQEVKRRPRVFLQIGSNPLVTASRGTFSNSVIEAAGGINVAARLRGRYPRVSVEEVVVMNPDVILISTMEGRDSRRLIERWKRWNVISAVRKERVYVVDSDLIDRPSPRCIMGIKKIFSLLYPSLTPVIARSSR